MHKLESVLENETQDSLRFLETNAFQNAARRPDLVLITKKKKIWSTSGSYRSGEP